MDAIAEIKKLYYSATKQTIQKDVVRAIELLKTLPTEEDRERVAVYMDGLSQMRSEWAPRPSGFQRPSSGRRGGAPRERSDRSK